MKPTTLRADRADSTDKAKSVIETNNQEREKVSTYNPRSPMQTPANDQEIVKTERILLGLAISDEAEGQPVVQSVVDFTEYSDYLYRGHQFIFNAIHYLHSTCAPIDTITVANRLNSQGLLETVGGTKYLEGCINAGGVRLNSKEYAGAIRDAGVSRQLRSLCHTTERALIKGELTVDQATEKHQSGLVRILSRKEASGPRHIAYGLDAALAEEEARLTAPRGITGWRTGFDTLDQLLGGLKPGLTVLAARTHVGKTAIAIQIAKEVARQTTVGVFSLEMDECSIGQRLLKESVKGTGERIEAGLFNSKEPDPLEELENFKRVAGKLKELSLYIDDRASVDINYITRKSQGLQLMLGCGLIIVDYLQIMSTGTNDPRYRRNEIGEATKQLRALGKSMDCPVILLSQLRRGEEDKENGSRPQIWQLKESGDIENNADVICLLHRPEMRGNDNREPPNIEKATMYVEKNRQTGNMGIVNMQFSRYSSSFYEAKY